MCSISSTWWVVIDDRLVLVEVVFQQVLVELLAVEDVEAQRGLVEHQQLGVDRHHQRQVQLHDHALGHCLDLHRRLAAWSWRGSARPWRGRTCGCTPATKSIASHTRSQRGRIATSAMKHTSCISASRWVRGSSPSTFSSPSNGISPSTAFSVVVLPEPFGPIRPTMRPAGMSKLTLSTATLLAVALGQALGGNHGAHAASSGVGGALQQLFAGRRPRRWMRSTIAGHSSRRKRSRSLASSFSRRAFGHVHAKSPSFFDKVVVDQLLVRARDGDRIELVVGGDLAHRGQHVAGLEHAVEHHADHAGSLSCR